MKFNDCKCDHSVFLVIALEEYLMSLKYVACEYVKYECFSILQVHHFRRYGYGLPNSFILAFSSSLFSKTFIKQ